MVFFISNNKTLLAEENKSLAPQQIQMKYENYTELIKSMKTVNQLLIDYSVSLKEIINN